MRHVGPGWDGKCPLPGPQPSLSSGLGWGGQGCGEVGGLEELGQGRGSGVRLSSPARCPLLTGAPSHPRSPAPAWRPQLWNDEVDKVSGAGAWSRRLERAGGREAGGWARLPLQGPGLFLVLGLRPCPLGLL